MAIINPRKKFNFRVNILPLPIIPTFSVQQITLGESAIDITEHGFGNTVMKTAGMLKVGNLTMERIMDATQGSIAAAIWAWHMLVQNPASQVGGNPLEYKRIIKIDELGTGFGSPVALNTWFAIGAWPATINGREYDRTSSDNIIESIEFAVDYVTMDIEAATILTFTP